MNKIDILLNTIAQKHLRIEFLECQRSHRLDAQTLGSSDIHAALLAAFEGGVRYASRVAEAPNAMIREVDICVE
ncbi:MAG: hypothetical protein V4739_01595 [Pseudomonadota bacterium]